MKPLQALESTAPVQNTIDTRDTLEKVRDTFAKELVIGLCGPVGAPLRKVGTALNELLTDDYAYKPEIIKLSDLIEQIKGKAPISADKYDRYEYLIQKGDELRKQYGRAILAELVVKHISMRRAHLDPNDEGEPSAIRFCHIVDSLKNTEEIELLRAVYGDLFVMISVHSSLTDRIRCLRGGGVSEGQISKLIDTDSGEDFKHGQEVRKAYPLADFFIHAKEDNTTHVKEKLRRIIFLVTRSKIVTPTRDESAMYHAHSASLNSGCLSRQVGAAATDESGEIIGLGWNDVPQFEGGLYSETSEDDHRCMHRDGGRCFNDLEKDILTEHIVDEVGAVVPAAKTLRLEIKTRLREGRVKDLIEFSRAVHAEMLAIINAALSSSGPRMRRGRMYVTTYPCHACARHIVAAGFREVVYIEPYKKSLAVKLHSDSVSEDPEQTKKVLVRPFEGVGPSRYASFFGIGSSTPRKDQSGKMLNQKTQSALFTASTSLKSIPALEGLIVQQLEKRGLVGESGPKKSA